MMLGCKLKGHHQVAIRIKESLVVGKSRNSQRWLPVILVLNMFLLKNYMLVWYCRLSRKGLSSGGIVSQVSMGGGARPNLLTEQCGH